MFLLPSDCSLIQASLEGDLDLESQQRMLDSFKVQQEQQEHNIINEPAEEVQYSYTIVHSISLVSALPLSPEKFDDTYSKHSS